MIGGLPVSIMENRRGCRKSASKEEIMKKKLAMLLAATMLATLFTGCGAGGKEDK